MNKSYNKIIICANSNCKKEFNIYGKIGRPKKYCSKECLRQGKILKTIEARNLKKLTEENKKINLELDKKLFNLKIETKIKLLNILEDISKPKSNIKLPLSLYLESLNHSMLIENEIIYDKLIDVIINSKEFEKKVLEIIMTNKIHTK